MNPTVKPPISQRQAVLAFLTLALASGVGVALVVARFVVSRQLAYFNLSVLCVAFLFIVYVAF
jgi:hypothetical protein